MKGGLFVLRGDLVMNVVVADPTGQWQPPADCSTIPIPDGCPAGIGWRNVDGQWVAPPPPPEPEPELVDDLV